VEGDDEGAGLGRPLGSCAGLGEGRDGQPGCNLGHVGQPGCALSLIIVCGLQVEQAWADVVRYVGLIAVEAQSFTTVLELFCRG
jgi:hypothetical protein